MFLNIPPEITIASFSLVGVLVGFVWNSQEKRIKKLECDVEKCPFPDIKTDIAQIKTDVSWLKNNRLK